MLSIDSDHWSVISGCCPQVRSGQKKLGNSSSAVYGRPRSSDLKCFEGILYILMTGSKWKSLPDRYPSPPTCWRRLRQWESEGCLECMLRKYINNMDVDTAAIWHASFSKAAYFEPMSHLTSRSSAVFQKAERSTRAMMARIFKRKFGRKIRLGEVPSDESFDILFARLSRESETKRKNPDDDNGSDHHDDGLRILVP